MCYNAHVPERQLIWRRVSYDREQLETRAPEGHEAVVEVYVHGRLEPVVPHYVETRSDGWVRLQCANGPAREDSKWSPEDILMHVREEAIARVEIRVRPTQAGRRSVGFSHAEAAVDSRGGGG